MVTVGLVQSLESVAVSFSGLATNLDGNLSWFCLYTVPGGATSASTDRSSHPVPVITRFDWPFVL